MSLSSLDTLLAASGKSVRFDRPGDHVSGTITSIAVRQKTEFGTGKPQTWDDGRPQEQIVVQLATTLRDPADPSDDGGRAAYIKGWGKQLSGFKAATTKLGRKPEIGDTLTVTHTGMDGQEKLYTYDLKAGDGGLGNVLGGEQPTPATTATQQAQGQGPAQGRSGPSPADEQAARQLLAIGTLDHSTIAASTGIDEATIKAWAGGAPF